MELRLYCINSKGWFRFRKIVGLFLKRVPIPGPKYGDTVTATGEANWNGDLAYELAEWPKTGPYDARGFIPLEAEVADMVVEKQPEVIEIVTRKTEFETDAA